MIPFNQPAIVGRELNYIRQSVKSGWIGGDGPFTKKCNRWFEEKFKAKKVLLTNSCTAALEMAAILCDIQPGDEIILPSFTFVSTASAFVMRGAKLVFVDIREDTLNIDEQLIERVVTKKTKAIVPVHYAGVGCDMRAILKLAKAYKLFVIEDAAQGVMASYRGKALGTWGDFGAYSFHETKNYTSGEGGALLVNDPEYIHRAEIVLEKGTNRKEFYRGLVDKYTWVDLGSSYLPSDIVAAFLYGQLEKAEVVTRRRVDIWNRYYQRLLAFEEKGLMQLPMVPPECVHNGHLFYMILRSPQACLNFAKYLKSHGVATAFHYVPLHRSPMAKRLGAYKVKLPVTDFVVERLLRLPVFYGLINKEQDLVVDRIYKWFK